MENRAAAVSRRTLPNGLRVVVAEAGAVPAFTAILSVEAGSRYEDEDRAGVAALTNALLLERPGAAGRELDVRVDSLGLCLDAIAGYETSALFATGLSSRCSEALSLMCELVLFPQLDTSDVEDAVQRQLTEIAEEEDDPYSVCRRALFEEVFAGHPRRRPIVGHSASVSALAPDHVAAFHRARYRPGHAVLSVAGDIEADRVVDDASRAFAPWIGSGIERTKLLPPAPLPGARTRRIEMHRAQVHVGLGSLGIRRNDPAYHAVLVMDAILGDGAGFGSRLASRLREAEGLAYVVESDAASTSGLDPGAFWIYTATSPRGVEGVLTGIRDELRRIRSEPPSDEELASAKAYILGRRLRALETTEVRAAGHLHVERYGLGDDYTERFPALIDAVGGEDVLSAARRVIDLDHSATILVGPCGEAGLP